MATIFRRGEARCYRESAAAFAGSGNNARCEIRLRRRTPPFRAGLTCDAPTVLGVAWARALPLERRPLLRILNFQRASDRRREGG